MTTSAQSSTSRRAAALGRLKTPSTYHWPWFVLAVLFIGYWLFVSSLERIDAHRILADILTPGIPPSQAELIPFPTLAIWFVELFHPRVLRHFIPIIAGWWLAVQAAISLMQVLYNCPDRRTAAEFLRRQRNERVSRMDVPFDLTPKNLEAMRDTSVLLSVGGPALVNVPDGHAAVTERNARFLRVLPPGVHALGRFEHIQSVVDLQPQEKTAKDVVLLTKEGIPVEADISLTFRIDPGENPVSHRRPYPFSVEAVKRAAYAGEVGPDGKASSWAGGPLGKVRGALAEMVSGDSLDELLAAERPRDAHFLLTDTVVRRVWDALPKDGIKPLRLRISRLSPPLEVSRQYTEYWLAHQRKADMLARANGTAQLVHDAETARASAEIAMIQAIVEGVRHAQQEAGSNLSGYLLALRLMEALRQMFLASAETLESAGGDTVELLEEISSVGHRLGDVQERIQLPPPKFRPSSPD